MNTNIKNLEKSIGYKFKTKNLLIEALTHPSYRHEINPDGRDNQRLEYLGDAVLGLVIADELFNKFKNQPEGMLSSIRSWYTKDDTLSEIAKEIELGEYILFGNGEKINQGSNKKSNLADSFEAVIGASWIDGGLKASKKIIKTVYSNSKFILSNDFNESNPKGKLQEYAQQYGYKAPEYHTVSITGPKHSPKFTIEVEYNDKIFIGICDNKRSAEKKAAQEVLNWIKNN